MTVEVPENWPEWPQDGLEHLGKCPVCESTSRKMLYETLIDRWFHAPGRWTMYQCSDCDSGYLDPRPNQATIGQAYKNYPTHQAAVPATSTDNRLAHRLRNGYLNTKYGYHMQPASRLGYLGMHLLPPPWRLEWDHYARHLPKPRPGHNKLLDVGCGNGEFLARARWQGWDVYGIDFDESALSHARDAGIPVVQGAIEPEKFASESFDAITSHQVIEHMHVPVAFLQSLYAWLKPGGRLWLGTPNINSDTHKHFLENWYLLHPPHHLVILSASAAFRCLHSAGFSRVKILPRGYCDSHIYEASAILQKSKGPMSYDIFSNRNAATLSIRQKLFKEMLSWVIPVRGSDFCIIADKL